MKNSIGKDYEEMLRLVRARIGFIDEAAKEFEKENIEFQLLQRTEENLSKLNKLVNYDTIPREFIKKPGILEDK